MALAECAMLGGIGAILQLNGAMEVALFSEDQGRAVITCAPENVEALLRLAADHGAPAAHVGSTGGDRLTVRDAFDLQVSALQTAWESES